MEEEGEERQRSSFLQLAHSPTFLNSPGKTGLATMVPPNWFDQAGFL